MKALTIIQPFAELIATGEKRVENREWYTPYRGPIAIHAGKAKQYEGRPVEAIANSYGLKASALAYGAIIATAEITDCLHVQQINRLPKTSPLYWLMDHEHAHGTYCWVLANVKRLEQPVPCRGALGLWEWKQ